MAVPGQYVIWYGEIVIKTWIAHHACFLMLYKIAVYSEMLEVFMVISFTYINLENREEYALKADLY